MKVSDLRTKEYHPYYKAYISLSPDIEYAEALIKSHDNVIEFLKGIPEEKLEYRYSEGKWTIKEILQHIIDTERIFSYRALRIAREDSTPLAGYEQDDYVPPSRANRLSLNTLLSDYSAVRNCTLSLYKSLDDAMLANIGDANGNPMSARAALSILVGHEIHHCSVIKEKYL